MPSSRPGRTPKAVPLPCRRATHSPGCPIASFCGFQQSDIPGKGRFGECHPRHLLPPAICRQRVCCIGHHPAGPRAAARKFSWLPAPIPRVRSTRFRFAGSSSPCGCPRPSRLRPAHRRSPLFGPAWGVWASVEYIV